MRHRSRFDWIAEPKLRRSALVATESAVRSGRLDADGRETLREALAWLLEHGDPSDRERVRAERLNALLGPGDAPAAG